MPGTTRYSATFDRTYEEEAKPSSPPNARRSRSQSWQANSGHDGRQYTPFASRSPAPRSSSQDNNPARGTEFIPTRTAKTSVKAHNNPFQFVKVGTCPLYKKAEEQLKKVKEIKKPDVLKEEEEEWQSNLDSWKSRRRKMSEDVFRRQEEIKLLELEEQIAQVSQKKTKTFSEMVESRATRGRALSLCLLTSPLEFQNWEYENKTHKNGSCSYTDESGENSTVNSEDEGVSMRRRHSESALNENEVNHNRTNGDAHTEHNGSKLDTQNGNCNKLSTNGQLKPKENSYIDSGLESISSSHRAGDTPDTGSDFSQDSNSSIDCDSPRTGVNVLEEFNAKSSQISDGHEINITLSLDEKGQDFGFTFLGGKDEGQVIIVSILEGSKAESSGVHLGDRIITINGCDVNSKKHIEIAALIQKGREKGLLNLLLWRHNKSANNTNESSSEEKLHKVDKNLNAKLYEKSIESENEMYVDDFEELKRQSELLANKKSDISNGNTEAPTNGNKSSNNDAKSFKTSTASSTAPILKINSSNSAVEKPDIDGEETKINNENQKKNIIKVKRVRRKGVYALNVDSNHNSQDGNSINSLFPLSPVTELPSPADETKTIASSLPSDDNTLLNSNSQNGIPNDGKQDGAEKQAETCVIQENNSSESISTKIENSKSAVLQTGLKDIDTKIKMKSENKTEITNAQLLNSKSKDSADDKSKSLTNSKKSKSNKLKKIITSENISVAPKSTKEFSSAAQLSDVTSNSVIQEKSSSDLKSYILESEQTDMKKLVEKPVVSEAMGNKVSCENVSIKSATEIVSIPNKTPETNTISHGNEIQSTDIVANGIETPLLNKQSNVSTSPEKPKKSMQKKTIAKPKAHPTEKSSVITTDAVLNEIYSTKEQSSFSVTEKQEKIASKNETTASLLQEENNVSLNDDVANKPQEIIIFPAKDETPIVSPSTNKVKDLALKFGDKSASTNSEPSLLSKNPKPVKSPLNEKSKPIFAKKEKIKAKENGVEQNPTSSLLTNSSLVSNTSDSSSKNKTTSNNEKQVKAEKKNEIVIDSSKMEKSVQQHFVTSQTMKQPSIPTVSSISSTKSTNKESKTKKVKVESASCPDKQSKIATKNQTVSTSHKRDNSDAQVCLDNKQVTNKAIASSITNTSDSCTSKNLIKGIQVEKEKKIPLAQDMEVKTVNKNNKVSPLTRVINFYKSYK